MTEKDKYSYENLEMRERAERLISNEIYLCQSSLVEELFKREVFNWDDVTGLIDNSEDSDGDNDEHYKEVYEWYAISEHLAEALKKLDYPVLENDYGFWMGRTTTGQAIVLDSIIYEVLKLIDKRCDEIKNEVI